MLFLSHGFGVCTQQYVSNDFIKAHWSVDQVFLIFSYFSFSGINCIVSASWSGSQYIWCLFGQISAWMFLNCIFLNAFIFYFPSTTNSLAMLLTASFCFYFLQDLIQLIFLVFQRYSSFVRNLNSIVCKVPLHVVFRILPWLLTETVFAMTVNYGHPLPREFLQYCQDALT